MTATAHPRHDGEVDAEQARAARTLALGLELDDAADRRALLAPRRDALEQAFEAHLRQADDRAADCLVALDGLHLQLGSHAAHGERLHRGARALGTRRPELAAYFELRRARAAYLRGYHEEAERLVRALRARLAHATGDAATHLESWPPSPREVALEAALVATAVWRETGRATEAELAAREVIAEARALGSAPGALRGWFHLGAALQVLDRHEEARAAYQRSLAIGQRLGAGRLRALTFANLADSARATGDLPRALAWCQAAADRLHAQGDALMTGKVLAGLASLQAEAGLTAEAEATLAVVRPIVLRTGDREAAVTARLTDAVLDRARGVPGRAEIALSEALWDADAIGLVALAARARRELAALCGPEQDEGLELQVGPQQIVGVSRGGPRRLIDVAERPALDRVLRRLIRARLDGEGALSVATLVAVGWPGEATTGTSGRARLYVAISTLRKLGLGASLHKSARGYRLDARVREVS